jgi:hypothetical protein
MFGSFFSALAARIRVNGIKPERFSNQPKIKIKNMLRIYYSGKGEAGDALCCVRI